MSIAANIRAARISAGLSQQDLARRLGLNQSQVSRIERGMRKVAAEELSEIAKSLGVTASDLLYR